MKKRNSYFREKRAEEIGFSDYTEMFEEGYSDTEISRELGVDEDYIRDLRNEYQNDY